MPRISGMKSPITCVVALGVFMLSGCDFLLLCISHYEHINRDSWQKRGSLEHGRRWCRCCFTTVYKLICSTEAEPLLFSGRNRRSS